MEHWSFTEKMTLIGFSISDGHLFDNQTGFVDIEGILAEAFLTIPHRSDKGRLLTILLTWIEAHGWAIIHEKLRKVLSRYDHSQVVESYTALAGAFAVSKKIKGWDYLMEFRPEKGVGLTALSDESAMTHRGGEPWAEQVNFRLAKGSLEPDPRWVMSRSQLASYRPEYRNRLIVGSNWRADVLSLVELGVYRPADIQKMIPISYEPAHRILKDLKDAGKFKVTYNLG